MDNNELLRDTFMSCRDYPVWYYKKLEEVSLDYVIFNLIKETFVVELNNKKIVMSFKTNENGEICYAQSCDDGLEYTSYETIVRAFKQGSWYRILDADTSSVFKEEYEAGKKKSSNDALREQRIKLLTNALIRAKEVRKFDIKDIDKRISELNDLDDEELQSLINILMKNCNP